MEKKRILALFSGGLDSLVSVFWMKKLGFEVIPIFFETPFFERKKAKHIAEKNGLDLQVIDITEEHLKMLISPVYGYGKHFNPCIDCHGLMFRVLKRYLDIFEADFLISGEVVNQRPMSQRYDSMNAVKKLSTVGDLIIRPLCQKRLIDTLPIREGWVKKDDLLDIQGRSRSEQLKIAEELGLKEIPNSGGGCLLTDKGYTKRLKEIIDCGQLDIQNIGFLKVGRHFRLNKNLKLVINRHTDELEYLHTVIKNEIIMKCKRVTGPIGILISKIPNGTHEKDETAQEETNNEHEISEEYLKIAGSILLRYCPKADDEETICYGKQFELKNQISCKRFTDNEIDPFRIN
ncbi:MAG: 7-cyano-7-deazaguanine synthase [Candidatus Cloacimonetes bacterium]|nr:7-cyano-7-deazaguanine synthase [Candidatus Cloacimonadota bacterium]